MDTNLNNAGVAHKIDTEMYVFQTSPEKKNWVRIDMYLFCNGNTTIYEGKKELSSSKDVYQLRMYWDGLLYDGVTPTEGILVAKEHPVTVKELIQIVNSMRDANGNNYNLKLNSWSGLGISF